MEHLLQTRATKPCWEHETRQFIRDKELWRATFFSFNSC